VTATLAMAGMSIAFTPDAVAAEHSPRSTAWYARCVATSDDEHAAYGVPVFRPVSSMVSGLCWWVRLTSVAPSSRMQQHMKVLRHHEHDAPVIACMVCLLKLCRLHAASPRSAQRCC